LSRNSVNAVVEESLTWLKAKSSVKVREEMGPRYGIHTEKAFGVGMAQMQRLAKELGSSHELAEALWKTGWYEARMVAAMIDVPEQVSAAQMDRWSRDFDNWGICDTVCFKLFDQTPHAFAKVELWAKSREEFVKRAAFALLASVALHDKSAEDSKFLRCLPLIERAASDERNFVKKGVSWALRSLGRRPGLLMASMELAEKLAGSENAAERWVGKDALKDLSKVAGKRQIQKKKSRSAAGK
jgi:3-methyladenine DNA glycosylase AlkD